MSFRWLSSVSCVGACFIMGLAACGGADSDGGNLGPDATGFAPARDAALPNVALRSIDTRIVRAIALALADSGIRTQVYRALHDSPFKDHKLQFSRYLHAGGSQLLAGAAAASGLDPASFLAAVDSLPQLEFYLPVPAHRARWIGGTDLIVAAALSHHETPIAFDLAGRPVTGMSSTTPPAAPTLAIVPAETNFDRVPVFFQDCNPAVSDCGGGSGGGGGDGGDGGGSGGGVPLPPNFRLIGINILDTGWDPWYASSPEFELSVYALDNSGNEYAHEDCYGGCHWVLDSWGCLTEARPTTALSYWDYDVPGTYEARSPAPVVIGDITVAHDLHFTQQPIRIVISENDDSETCDLGFAGRPSIGNPNPLANDDDSVAVFNIGVGLHDVTVSAQQYIQSLRLAYSSPGTQ